MVLVQKLLFELGKGLWPIPGLGMRLFFFLVEALVVGTHWQDLNLLGLWLQLRKAREVTEGSSFFPNLWLLLPMKRFG